MFEHLGPLPLDHEVVNSAGYLRLVTLEGPISLFCHFIHLAGLFYRMLSQQLPPLVFLAIAVLPVNCFPFLQIDGFEQDKKVVVIAATNRKQDLDPALIR